MTNATYTADPTSTISFDQVIDGLGAITDGTVTNPQTTTCTVTVATDLGTLVAVLTGTGLTYQSVPEEALVGGTITGINFTLNGAHQGNLSTSLAVGDLLNAVATEEGGDTSAIEHFFMGFNWTYNGNNAADNVLPGLVVGDNVPFNLTGDDHISLSGGDDHFYSGDGNDTINTGAGFDQVFAGNGNDTITAGVNAFVDAGDGDDTITTATYSTATPFTYAQIRGGNGNDTIHANTAGSYRGGAGNDRLISSDTGNDDGNFMLADYSDATSGIVANLTASGGNNANGFQIADGQGGVDRVSGFTTIVGSTHNDIFRVDSTYTSLYGNFVEIRMGAGDDNAVFTGVAHGSVSYFGGSVGGAVFADLRAGTATDLNPGDNFIGNDTFSGEERFRGTQFNDVIHGSNGNDLQIRGETGDDLIFGHQGNDYLDGDDRSGNPLLSGNDTLVGGAGNDTLDGNNGIDTADYGRESGTNGVTVNLVTGTATDTFGGTDTLVDIENVTGTARADNITARIDSFVDAGDGNDNITTAAYSTATPFTFATIRGGNGNDTIHANTAGSYRGGVGNDRLISSDTGNDDGNFMLADYSDATSGIIVNLTATGGNNANGFLIADGQGGVDRVSGFTTIMGSAHNDIFRVDSTYTSLYGNWVELRMGAGNDNAIFTGVAGGTISYFNGDIGGGVLADLQHGTATDLNSGDHFIGSDMFSGAMRFRGTRFNDRINGSDSDGILIRGETGDDTIIGGAGNEYLDGDDRGGNPDISGNDTLTGGAGNDTLDGNNGIDIADYGRESGTRGVTVNLLTGTATDTFGDTDTLIGIENVVGTDNNDTLTGDDGNNILDGGAGRDTASFNFASSQASITHLANGDWQVSHGGSVDTLSNIEVLRFTDKDRVLGQAGRDFNGDGTSDILWRNASGVVAIWEMGDGYRTGTTAFADPGGTWGISGVGDFNADGTSDILWRNASGVVAVWEMGDGHRTGSTAFADPGGTWDIAGVGDFNADGTSDILWRNASGVVATWEMGDGHRTGSTAFADPGGTWGIGGVGDFNGDGTSDILWRNASGVVAIWEMGDGHRTGSTAFADPGGTWGIAGVGDYNGDGTSDILWRNASGVVAVWTMGNGHRTGSTAFADPGGTWNIA
jgi:Ca2+-binding RTX toxin-like protein